MGPRSIGSAADGVDRGPLRVHTKRFALRRVWCHHLTMQPDAADQVKQIVRELVPQLDSIGFHINSIGGPSEAGRLTISYDESTEVPGVLVAAIAGVTRSDVDFFMSASSR